MKNYRKYTQDRLQIIDGGTQWMSAEDVESYDGQIAVVEVGQEPTDVENYTIEGGQLVKASPELIAERQAAKARTEAVAEIAQLRAYLTQTDYAPIKCGELGLVMADEYPDIHAERTAARARIKELQEGGAE